MKKDIEILYKFVLRSSRHYAFKTYSRPFLLLWIKQFCEKYSIEKPRNLDEKLEETLARIEEFDEFTRSKIKRNLMLLNTMNFSGEWFDG